MTDTTGLLALPNELLEWKASLRRFVDNELIPHEASGSDNLPPEALEKVKVKARELGIWAADVPTRFGGAGLGALEYAIATEELGRSIYWLDVMELGAVMSPLFRGTEEQIERYVLPSVEGTRAGAFALTEPTGGSDPARAIQTTAVRDGDNWVLNGSKCFISRGHVADHFVVMAATDKEKGAHGGITVFVVDRDTPGFEVVRQIRTMGTMAPSALTFDDVIVPDTQRVGDVGEGFILAQQTLGPQRIGIGARAIGVCTRLIELAIEQGRTREVWGKLLESQGMFQAKLADCAIELEACRWMVYRAAAEMDREADTRTIESAVKVYASELMSRVADKVMQVWGGWGYSKDLPIERLYRDHRMWQIVEGPNDVHRMVVARRLISEGMATLEESKPRAAVGIYASA
ncbi:MAG: acyl-CoA dehydrogenase family protein [Gammaproteobacteria bacterium]|nr:acyl-CoA dehydrogenase family protein [Gammaproteobacteria bacterium]MDD9963471.1 acyl-CoA dehydrogenase family protein [Gammaproteobacteria bacterium]MDE0273843.1 acyl-CoA dehydrogenase family protein [Gammaproteobacteria bacterium]